MCVFFYTIYFHNRFNTMKIKKKSSRFFVEEATCSEGVLTRHLLMHQGNELTRVSEKFMQEIMASTKGTLGSISKLFR